MKALVLVLLLSGCASAPYWEQVAEPARDIRVHHVDAMPGTAYGHVGGMAVRNKDGSCDIFVMRRAANPSCIEAHERKHCAGWDHPKYNINLAC